MPKQLHEVLAHSHADQLWVLCDVCPQYISELTAEVRTDAAQVQEEQDPRWLIQLGCLLFQLLRCQPTLSLSAERWSRPERRTGTEQWSYSHRKTLQRRLCSAFLLSKSKRGFFLTSSSIENDGKWEWNPNCRFTSITY